MLLEPIHGVVTSDGYGDYLEVSLSHNRELFDHCVVATSTADTESQRIAGKYDCTLIVTDEHKAGGGFNKGMLVERALQQLPSTGYHCHFDADTILPGNTRRRLAAALHDRQGIYGADRMNVVGWDAYQQLLATGWATRGFEHHHFLSYSINRAEIGSRLIYGDQSWVPLGYFQLWHSSVEYTGIYRTRPYAVGSASCAHDDVQFALRFDRRHRHLIPEFLVAHLVTDDSGYGVNWNGRKTKKFGPAPQKAGPAAEGYHPTVYRGVVELVHGEELVLRAERVHVFRVPATCTITLDGHPAKLTQLRHGYRAEVTAERGTALKIVARRDGGR